MNLIFQNKILWIDEKNLTARVQSGMIGQELERQVNDELQKLVENKNSIRFS
jgi:FAD/FMN-containing dehydrogenase